MRYSIDTMKRLKSDVESRLDSYGSKDRRDNTIHLDTDFTFDLGYLEKCSKKCGAVLQRFIQNIICDIVMDDTYDTPNAIKYYDDRIQLRVRPLVIQFGVKDILDALPLVIVQHGDYLVLSLKYDEMPKRTVEAKIYPAALNQKNYFVCQQVGGDWNNYLKYYDDVKAWEKNISKLLDIILDKRKTFCFSIDETRMRAESYLYARPIKDKLGLNITKYVPLAGINTKNYNTFVVKGDNCETGTPRMLESSSFAVRVIAENLLSISNSLISLDIVGWRDSIPKMFK